MKLNLNLFSYLILLFVIVSVTSSISQVDRDVAIMLKTSGDVRLKKSVNKKWYYGKRGVRLDSGDIVKTAQNSIAAIMFTDDKSLIKIRDNSLVAIKGKREKNSISKRLLCTVGNFWAKVTKQKAKFVVETPSGIAAVKGTEFYGTVGEDGSMTIITVEGIVELMNELGSVLVNAGETGNLNKNQKPEKFITPENEKPDWAKEANGDDQELKLEFRDDQGNTKTLRINFQKEERGKNEK